MMDEKEKSMVQEIRENVIILVEKMTAMERDSDNKNKILEQKLINKITIAESALNIEVSKGVERDNKIAELEKTNKWLTRTFIAAVIVAVVGVFFSFVKFS